MISTSENKAFYSNRSLRVKSKIIDLSKPLVMGILNINADSFFDGGQYQTMDAAIEQCAKMLKDGADIIDIGPASSKPGSTLIEPDNEWKLLKPFINSLRENFPQAVFSIDTYNSRTAEKSILAGAHIINDISGGIIDPQMTNLIGELKVPYILMHMQGTPENMQHKPQYTDVFKELSKFFSKQIDRFYACGADDIILDIGLGFGKTLEHNYQLLNCIDLFKNTFGLPLLAGTSRKSMINKLLDIKPNEALNGTSVVNTIALQKGVDILRVHDVKEAQEACKIVTFTKNFN